MNILRWILVLPAAVCAQSAVQLIVGGAFGLLGPGVRESSFANWLHLLVHYVVSEMAFVVAGALTAPRRQSVIAITLSIIGVGLSLMQHVIGQHLAGNRVGSTNYLHFSLETAGLLAGAVFIVVTVRKQRIAPPG